VLVSTVELIGRAPRCIGTAVVSQSVGRTRAAA
jgi:hypothetical protein